MNAWTVPGYTELRELGAGAAGRVVLARHDATDAPVAIKYLSVELWADEDFLSRFRGEARLMGDLQDPNIAAFYEYVETETAAAIVMELVDGAPLRALLREEGATGPEAALVVLKGSLLGLATAHQRGVVHRDYKPENVLVQQDGTSKLVDFGIAVRAGQPDIPAGTPSYMAPEQFTGAPSSPATDVYAATAVFFECLTGRKPYIAPTLETLMYQHQTAPIPVDDVPDQVRELVERGLAKNPLDRPVTALDFVDELEEIAERAYGPDWEWRGRRRLAELAGLLALLFPLAQQGAVGGGTTLAQTVLGRLRGRGVQVVAGAALTIGVLGTGALLLNGGKSGNANASQAFATSQPSTGQPDPTPSDLPTESPTPTPTTTVTPPATPTPAPTTPTPTATKTTTPPKPAIKITGLSVTWSLPGGVNGAGAIGVARTPDTTASGTVTAKTNGGTGSATITVSYSTPRAGTIVTKTVSVTAADPAAAVGFDFEKYCGQGSWTVTVSAPGVGPVSRSVEATACPESPNVG